MIDREKVLKGLECCCSMTGEACRQCPYDEECAEMIGSGSAHLCADALELLKDEPLPVLNITKFNCYHGDCPACGERIHYKKSHYCPYCGKAVNWD